MHQSFFLTVAEAKRVIAKGIAAFPVVKQAVKEGIVIICAGTTNGYVIEEITGKPFAKNNYVTGRTMGKNLTGEVPSKSEPDFIMKDGEIIEGVSVDEIMGELKAGDVFLKGVNAINYDLDQAGILIGHPTGGTIGAALGTIIAKRVNLIHPVGLEKSIPGDLTIVSSTLAEPEGKGPTLFVTPGEIFTELEAITVLTGCATQALAAGGIGGAEGATWLTAFGTEDELESLNALLKDVKDEAPFPG